MSSQQLHVPQRPADGADLPGGVGDPAASALSGRVNKGEACMRWHRRSTPTGRGALPTERSRTKSIVRRG
jgi:hypothetical protein